LVSLWPAGSAYTTPGHLKKPHELHIPHPCEEEAVEEHLVFKNEMAANCPVLARVEDPSALLKDGLWRHWIMIVERAR